MRDPSKNSNAVGLFEQDSTMSAMSATVFIEQKTTHLLPISR